MAVANAHARAAAQRSKLKTIPVVPLGASLSLFFAISFVLCVLGYFLEKTFALQLQIAHSAIALVLPGFAFESWPKFFLGLIESVAWGWYIALIFGPLFNFFVARRG